VPNVQGILETALYVTDLPRSAQFYKRLFGFETLIEDDRIHALRVPGNQVLLLFRLGGSTRPTEAPGGTIPPHDGRGQIHMAFAITAEEVETWQTRLAEQGIPLESHVRAGQGGHSLYFRDPDGHCIELATPSIWE
jgi:catechol 2,3-dioxygenase-like lactoylglutathione lyase family enzyme